MASWRKTVTLATLLMTVAGSAKAGAAEVAPEGASKAGPDAQWSLVPSVDLAAARFLEGGAFGGRGGAELSLSQRWSDNRALYSATLRHEPFALRVYNFGGDEAQVTATRLTQTTDTLRGAVGWQRKWGGQLATEGVITAAQRWAENGSDERRLTEARWSVEQKEFADWKALTLAGNLEYGLSIYPNYRVADRTIDSEWGGVELVSSLALNRAFSLEAGYAIRSAQYLDAKYESVGADGQTVTRSSADKSLLRGTGHLGLNWRVDKTLKISTEAELLRNDYSDYTRMMSGRDGDGQLERRLIRDYEDSLRALLRASASYRAADGWKMRLAGEGWSRGYDTYQARGEDNRWLEQLRSDWGVSADLSAEAVVNQTQFYRITATLDGSYDKAVSNMERELSFATNYAVTRVYLGIMIEGVE